MAVACLACQRSFKNLQGLALHWTKCRKAKSTTRRLIERIESGGQKWEAGKVARRNQKDVTEERQMYVDYIEIMNLGYGSQRFFFHVFVDGAAILSPDRLCGYGSSSRWTI